MKYLILIAAMAFAHEEGHGPKVGDTAKYGGIVSGVVLKSEAGKGAKAGLIYKSELARAEDGTVRIYVYDGKMNQLDLSAFDAKASAVVISKKKSASFELSKDGKAFVGIMPKPARKPYDIDVTLKEKDRELLTAFDNLD